MVPDESIDLGGKEMSYQLSLQECNCTNYSSKLLSLVEYGEKGEVLSTENYQKPEISYSAPGSVSYSYISDICSRYNKKKK
jgi:hypothetical protein